MFLHHEVAYSETERAGEAYIGRQLMPRCPYGGTCHDRGDTASRRSPSVLAVLREKIARHPSRFQIPESRK